MYYYFIGKSQSVYERDDLIDTELFPKFVLLTKEQVSYHIEHPYAKRWEIEHHNDPIPEPIPQDNPRVEDILNALRTMFKSNIAELSDNDAYASMAVFPTWSSYLGKQINAGERVWDDNRLWKCRKSHTIQSDWRPAVATSLWEEISLEDGTKEHPIHYNNNMRLELNKYYTQYDVRYKCISDTVNPVYHDLKDLVNLFVIVE